MGTVKRIQWQFTLETNLCRKREREREHAMNWRTPTPPLVHAWVEAGVPGDGTDRTAFWDPPANRLQYVNKLLNRTKIGTH